MISPMVRVTLYGPRTLLSKTTALLQLLGIMHIDQADPAHHTGFRPLEKGKKEASDLIELETLLERVRKILLLLPPPGKGGAHSPAGEISPVDEGFSQLLAGVLREAEDLHRRLNDAREEFDILSKYERVIEGLAPLLEGIDSSPWLEMVGVTFERGGSDILPLLREALTEIAGDDFQIFSADLDHESIAAVIVYGKSHAPLVRNLLFDRNISEIRLPGRVAGLPLTEALRKIRGEIETLPAAVKSMEEELELFSSRWHARLISSRVAIADQLEQEVMSKRFLCTKYSFLIRGWVPRRIAGRLERKVRYELGGKVVVELEEEGDRKLIPVQIVNPSFIRPFEIFTRLLPLPAYGTIDPAPFFGLFFPLFFGLILGDIGYGLVLLALALALLRKTPSGTLWHDAAAVLAISSTCAIFFGVLFGEFFSTLGEEFHLLQYIGRATTGADGSLTYHPILYDRIEAMLSFFFLSVAVGFIHVVLGLALGILTALRTGRYLRLAAKSGMLCALLSLLTIILSFSLPMPAPLLWTAAAVLALSLIGTTLIDGFVAPIEIVSTLGNILSYARIMAVGLASVILGLVANRLGKIPDSVALGILIAASLHIVNIALAVFSPTIHSMRLHFVEFFGKFYEPGGRPFKPFHKSGGA